MLSRVQNTRTMPTALLDSPNYIFIIILYCYSLLVKARVSRMVCVWEGRAVARG